MSAKGSKGAELRGAEVQREQECRWVKRMKGSRVVKRVLSTGVQGEQGCRGARLMSAKRSKGVELRGAESRGTEGTGVQMHVENEGEQRDAESAELRGAESSGEQGCRGAGLMSAKRSKDAKLTSAAVQRPQGCRGVQRMKGTD